MGRRRDPGLHGLRRRQLLSGERHVLHNVPDGRPHHGLGDGLPGHHRVHDLRAGLLRHRDELRNGLCGRMLALPDGHLHDRLGGGQRRREHVHNLRAGLRRHGHGQRHDERGGLLDLRGRHLLGRGSSHLLVVRRWQVVGPGCCLELHAVRRGHCLGRNLRDLCGHVRGLRGRHGGFYRRVDLHNLHGRHLLRCQCRGVHKLRLGLVLGPRRSFCLHSLRGRVLLGRRRAELHDLPDWHLHDKLGDGQHDAVHVHHVRARLHRNRHESRHGNRRGLHHLRGRLLLQRGRSRVHALPAGLVQRNRRLEHVRLLLAGNPLLAGRVGQHADMPRRMVLRELRHSAADGAVSIWHLLDLLGRHEPSHLHQLSCRPVVPCRLQQHA